VGSSSAGGFAVACLASVATLAACGQSDDRRQVRKVTDRFYAALARHDGARACAQISEATAKEVASQEQKPCRDAILELELGGGRATRVQVYVTSAKVDLSSGQSVFLGRTASGWRLDALACKPEEGKPSDRPFECELKA
jgi:hypothetical protein